MSNVLLRNLRQQCILEQRGHARMMHYVSDAAIDQIQERINSAAVDEFLLQVSNGDTNIPSEDVYPMLVLMEMGRLMGYRQGTLETLKTLGIEGVDDVVSF